MKNKVINCILFDFDGVLIDSLPAMKIAWKSVQKKFGISNTFADYKKYIGLPFQEILNQLNIDKKYHKGIKEHYSKISSQNKELIKLNPYVNYTLDWLKGNFIKTGIVTSKDKVRTLDLIQYFQLNVEIVVTPESTEFGKPSSQPVLFAAKNLKLNTNEIIFVGDMESDMNCAFNANCHYLHYKNGYQYLYYQMYGGEISSIIELIEYIKNF